MSEDRIVFNREVHFEDMVSRNVLEKRNIHRLLEATPNVLNREFFECANSSPITVTDFLNGSPGQRLYILGDGNTTIEHGTFIFTSTGLDKLLAQFKVYCFTFFPIEGPPKSHKWVEDVDEDSGGGGGSGITQLTDDVTAGPGTGTQVATIANDAVTFAKMQNINTQRLIGRNSGGSGDPEEVTISQALDWLT